MALHLDAAADPAGATRARHDFTDRLSIDVSAQHRGDIKQLRDIVIDRGRWRIKTGAPLCVAACSSCAD